MGLVNMPWSLSFYIDVLFQKMCLHVCVCVLCINVSNCMCIVYMQEPMEVRKRCWIPGIGVTDDYEPSWCLELNLSPVQEQQMF